MNISGVGSRLGGNVASSVSHDVISVLPVSSRKCQNDLWPARDVDGCVNQLKGIVPHDPLVCMLRFVGVL